MTSRSPTCSSRSAASSSGRWRTWRPSWSTRPSIARSVSCSPSWWTSTTSAPAPIRRAGSRTEPVRGLRRVLPGGAGAPGRALQLRDVPDPEPSGGRRPRPGNLSAGFPIFPPVSAGNPSPRLAVSNFEEHLLDLLSASRAGIRARRGRCPHLGCPDVSRRARGVEWHRRGAHGSRARPPAPARGVPNRAPARGSRRHGARGRGARAGLSGRHRQVTDLQGEGAVARALARLRQAMSGDHSPDSDEALGTRLRAELPRYTASAHLRAAIAEGAAPPRRRAAWLAPVLTAAATALVLGLVFLPLLPRLVPADPTERLRRAVRGPRTRAPPWGGRAPPGIPPAVARVPPEAG